MPAIPVSDLALTGAYPDDAQMSERRDVRAHPEVPAVACHRIPDIAILDQRRPLLDLDIVRCHFLREGRLTLRQAMKAVADAATLLAAEPTLVRVDCPACIIGDIHGQFYDLIALLDQFDLARDTLVFLGDYVDRGQFSVETYLYLLILKAHHPERVILLRGNHESEKMTRYFTFRTECITKYGTVLYERIVESFHTLPLAAVVQGKAFCAHGGISPALRTLADVERLNRFVEPPYSGLMCDLLWADPHPQYARPGTPSWAYNDKRNCSHLYSLRDVRGFLERTGLQAVIRGHEVQAEGCQLYEPINGVPSVVTVFSAPNYCDFYKNTGAVLEFNDGVRAIRRFQAVPHPHVLPGAANGWTWSAPLIAEQLIGLATALFDAAAEVPPLPPAAQPAADVVRCPASPCVEEQAGSLAMARVEHEMAAEVRTHITCSLSALNLADPAEEVAGVAGSGDSAACRAKAARVAAALDAPNEAAVNVADIQAASETVMLSPSEQTNIPDTLASDTAVQIMETGTADGAADGQEEHSEAVQARGPPPDTGQASITRRTSESTSTSTESHRSWSSLFGKLKFW